MLARCCLSGGGFVMSGSQELAFKVQWLRIAMVLLLCSSFFLPVNLILDMRTALWSRDINWYEEEPEVWKCVWKVPDGYGCGAAADKNESASGACTWQLDGKLAESVVRECEEKVSAALHISVNLFIGVGLIILYCCLLVHGIAMFFLFSSAIVIPTPERLRRIMVNDLVATEFLFLVNIAVILLHVFLPTSSYWNSGKAAIRIALSILFSFAVLFGTAFTTLSTHRLMHSSRAEQRIMRLNVAGDVVAPDADALARQAAAAQELLIGSKGHKVVEHGDLTGSVGPLAHPHALHEGFWPAKMSTVHSDWFLHSSASEVSQDDEINDNSSVSQGSLQTQTNAGAPLPQTWVADPLSMEGAIGGKVGNMVVRKGASGGVEDDTLPKAFGADILLDRQLAKGATNHKVGNMVVSNFAAEGVEDYTLPKAFGADILQDRQLAKGATGHKVGNMVVSNFAAEGVEDNTVPKAFGADIMLDRPLAKGATAHKIGNMMVSNRASEGVDYNNSSRKRDCDTEVSDEQSSLDASAASSSIYSNSSLDLQEIAVGL